MIKYAINHKTNIVNNFRMHVTMKNHINFYLKYSTINKSILNDNRTTNIIKLDLIMVNNEWKNKWVDNSCKIVSKFIREGIWADNSWDRKSNRW
jgi:hypothetical protein